jgi:hypothetical protein
MDEGELARFVARSIELGLGRVKSAFFAGITPGKLVERAPELWRWQHTHGELSASMDGQTGMVTLADHPYVESAASRRLTAESYRHIVTMAGARDVRAAWSAVPRGHGSAVLHALVVRLSWRF